MIGGNVTEFYYYALLTIFAVVVYMMAVDENVGKWILLQLQLFRINMMKRWFVLTLGIRLRYDNYKLKRALIKIRKDYGIHSDD
jgi:hypothetical protein